MVRKALSACLLVVAAVTSRACGVQASFGGLGFLPGPILVSEAYDVSADGLVVVGEAVAGNSSPAAFRWTAQTGMVSLGYIDDVSLPYSGARAVSADGSIVVGYSKSKISDTLNAESEAFRWVDHNGDGRADPGEMQGLGHLFTGSGSKFEYHSEAYGVSGDGSAVIGWSRGSYGSPPRPANAFKWDASNGMTSVFDSSQQTYAYDISADGSSVVGIKQGAVFRWRDLNGNGRDDPGETINLGFNGRGLGVSADGSVVVGYESWEVTGWMYYEPFRWEDINGNGQPDAGEAQRLGLLPGVSGVQAHPGEAHAVSADGSVVVGWSTGASGKRAFIWDAANGMRALGDVLADDLGLNLSGWSLTSAEGISADGLTIVGYGTNPSGNTEAWIATVPEPASAILLLMVLPWIVRRRRAQR